MKNVSIIYEGVILDCRINPEDNDIEYINHKGEDLYDLLAQKTVEKIYDLCIEKLKAVAHV